MFLKLLHLWGLESLLKLRFLGLISFWFSRHGVRAESEFLTGSQVIWMLQSQWKSTAVFLSPSPGPETHWLCSPSSESVISQIPYTLCLSSPARSKANLTLSYGHVFPVACHVGAALSPKALGPLTRRCGRCPHGPSLLLSNVSPYLLPKTNHQMMSTPPLLLLSFMDFWFISPDFMMR